MMNETQLLERAIAIAVEGHKDQLDKAGAPYILHPLRVMLSLATPLEKTVGVLHDVVEDCKHKGWTPEKLASEGIPEFVLQPLGLVTKPDDADNEEGWPFDRLVSEGFPDKLLEHFRPQSHLTKDEVYDAYIRLAATHPIARAVKLADLEDNMDTTRIGELTDKDRARLAKYQKAHTWLLNGG